MREVADRWEKTVTTCSTNIHKSNKLCAHNGQTIVILCFGEAEHGYLVQYHPRKGDITQVSQVLALPCQPQSLC